MLCVSLAVLLCLFGSVLSQCVNRRTSDSIPTNPGISGDCTHTHTHTCLYLFIFAYSFKNIKKTKGAADESGLQTWIASGYSERVTVITQGEYNSNTYNYPRNDCPHLQSGLLLWES